MKRNLERIIEVFDAKIKDLYYRNDIIGILNLEVNFMRGKIRKDEPNYKRLEGYRDEIKVLQNDIEDLYREYSINDGDILDLKEVLKKYNIEDTESFIAELLKIIDNILE